MIQEYLAICGSMSPLGKVVLAGDLGIAVAYFAIPVSLVIVWRRRMDDLPHPWLFGLFAAFIVSCGVTHLVHAIQMPWTTVAHTLGEAIIKTITAVLSIGTAAALAWTMPKILRAVSPAERARELEREVAARTAEKDALMREINHRLGNFLQVVASAIRLETKKADENGKQILGRLDGLTTDLARQYHDEEHRYSAAALKNLKGSKVSSKVNA